MGEIVNLRTVKKTRARTEAKQAAQESRVRHGRTGAEKANDAREAARRQAALDGKKTT
jgi:hypothetical protein